MRSLGSAFLLLLLVASSSASAQEYKLKYPLGLKKMKIPKDNPLTTAKIELGKQLYFDARLSRRPETGRVGRVDIAREGEAAAILALHQVGHDRPVTRRHHVR